MGEPLEELGRHAGTVDGQLQAALASETILSLVPEVLDVATGQKPSGGHGFLRFHEPSPPSTGAPFSGWGDPDAPLVYVTFGSVTGSLPPFAGAFRQALDALAELEVRVLMTVGRPFDIAGLGPVPTNARVAPWLLQQAEAAALVQAVLEDPAYTAAARRMAEALRSLPPATEAVPGRRWRRRASSVRA